MVFDTLSHRDKILIWKIDQALPQTQDFYGLIKGNVIPKVRCVVSIIIICGIYIDSA